MTKNWIRLIIMIVISVGYFFGYYYYYQYVFVANNIEIVNQMNPEQNKNSDSTTNMKATSRPVKNTANILGTKSSQKQETSTTNQKSTGSMNKKTGLKLEDYLGYWKSTYCEISGAKVDARGYWGILLKEDGEAEVQVNGEYTYDTTYRFDSEKGVIYVSILPRSQTGTTYEYKLEQGDLVWITHNGNQISDRLHLQKAESKFNLPDDLIYPQNHNPEFIEGEYKESSGYEIISVYYNNKAKSDFMNHMDYNSFIWKEAGGYYFFYGVFDIDVYQYENGILKNVLHGQDLVPMESSASTNKDESEATKLSISESASILPGTWYSLLCVVDGENIDGHGYYTMSVDSNKNFTIEAKGSDSKHGKWFSKKGRLFFDDNHENDIYADLYSNEVLIVELDLGTVIYMVKNPDQYSHNFETTELFSYVPNEFVGTWVSEYYMENGKKYNDLKWTVDVYNDLTMRFDIEKEPISWAEIKSNAFGDRIYIFDYYGINIAYLDNGKMIINIGDGSFVYLKKLE